MASSSPPNAALAVASPVSLDHLSRHPATSRYFYRVSDSFVRIAHAHTAATPEHQHHPQQQQQSRPPYHRLMDTMKCMHQMKASGVSGRTSDDRFRSEQADHLLRSLVNEHLVAPHMDDPIIAKNHKPSVFPGPMSMQMGRRSLLYLRDNDYWITEKSDGIRAMMLVMRLHDFPRWHWREPGPTTGSAHQAERAYPLWDQCALEEAWTTLSLRMRTTGAPSQHHHRQQQQQQRGSNDASSSSSLVVTLQDGMQYRMALHQQQQQQGEAPVVTLERVSTAGQQLGESAGERRTFPIYRGRGRSIAYMFDRNYEFYLCRDEYCFPTQSMKEQTRTHPERPLTFQDVIIVDGEIVYNLLEKRYNYSLFDIAVFCFTDPQRPGSSIPCHCVKRNMSERISYIKNHVIEAYYFYYKGYLRVKEPSSLKFMCKHFYRKSDLHKVLEMIVPDPNEKGSFLYKNYNRNDGLIFTPDSAELYSVKPGACEYLLKWKWASQLTCDFVGELTPESPRPSHNPEFLYYNMFFAIRNEPIFYRCIKLAYNDILQKFYGQHPTAVNGTVVLECLYDGSHLRNWDVFCVRVDKSHANSFRTIANTIENAMEDITEEDLSSVCLSSQVKPATQIQFYNNEQDITFQRTLEQNDQLTHYRVKQWTVDGKAEYVLQYWVWQNDEKAPERKRQAWKRYLTLLDCLGPNNESGQQLLEMMKEHWTSYNRNLSPEQNLKVAQRHEIYVSCIFVARYGKWKIVRFSGRAEKATARHLLEMIEKMNDIHFALKAQQQQQQQSHANGGASRKRDRGSSSGAEEQLDATKRQRTEGSAQ